MFCSFSQRSLRLQSKPCRSLIDEALLRMTRQQGSVGSLATSANINEITSLYHKEVCIILIASGFWKTRYEDSLHEQNVARRHVLNATIGPQALYDE
jgi:hypothetical protein